MRIICYELNEVPWRVIDEFVARYPQSALAKLLPKSMQLTTVSHDSGELHPWSTWPSLHRGVYNDQHHIRFINQDLDNQYPPIWQLLASQHIAVGVFGSLQSWPVPKDLPYQFYVPDTFAKDPQTLPAELQYFQSFNLAQTKSDGGAEPQPVKIQSNLLGLLLGMIRTGLSFKTVFYLAMQLLREKVNPLAKSIRSLCQAPVAFDFYYRLLKNKQPAFSTFFTNHVAGMMHRYWKQLFPRDFAVQQFDRADRFKAGNIMRAMKIADRQIAKLQQFADQHDYVLMIASSMGQEAIDRGEYLGELRIADIEQFYRGIGFTGEIENHLAMQPDFAFSFKQQSELNDFHNRVAQLTGADAQPIFTFKQIGLSLNCNLKSRPDLLQIGIYQAGQRVDFAKLGIEILKRDQGTGYHQPYGIWLVYQKGIVASATRQEVELAQVAPTLLNLFGLKAPSYMQAPVTEVLENLKQHNK
jgi:hypothetical protein